MKSKVLIVLIIVVVCIAISVLFATSNKFCKAEVLEECADKLVKMEGTFVPAGGLFLTNIKDKIINNPYKRFTTTEKDSVYADLEVNISEKELYFKKAIVEGVVHDPGASIEIKKIEILGDDSEFETVIWTDKSTYSIGEPIKVNIIFGGTAYIDFYRFDDNKKEWEDIKIDYCDCSQSCRNGQIVSTSCICAGHAKDGKYVWDQKEYHGETRLCAGKEYRVYVPEQTRIGKYKVTYFGREAKFEIVV